MDWDDEYDITKTDLTSSTHNRLDLLIEWRR